MADSDIAMNVLVIDDDPIMCEMIKDTITKKFPMMRVQIFNTGEEALDSGGYQPDIVILDYSLDSVKADAMNGLQVLNKFRERSESTPIIFLSSQDKPEVAAHTIKYGAYDYILKTETAFAKLEIALQNLVKMKSLEKVSLGQKIMNSAFWILLGFIFVYIVISQFIGK